MRQRARIALGRLVQHKKLIKIHRVRHPLPDAYGTEHRDALAQKTDGRIDFGAGYRFRKGNLDAVIPFLQFTTGVKEEFDSRQEVDG